MNFFSMQANNVFFFSTFLWKYNEQMKGRKIRRRISLESGSKQVVQVVIHWEGSFKTLEGWPLSRKFQQYEGSHRESWSATAMCGIGKALKSYLKMFVKIPFSLARMYRLTNMLSLKKCVVIVSATILIFRIVASMAGIVFPTSLC